MKLGRALASVGLLFGMGGLLVVALKSVEGRERTASPLPCTCALERGRNGWCESCSVGYVAEVPIRSQELYDALDAHGHDVDLPGLACASCREAGRSDGFCEVHGRGFVGGRAYLSRLAYHLARGEPESVETELALLATAIGMLERCDLCAAAMVLDGTCPKCRLSYRDGRASPAR